MEKDNLLPISSMKTPEEFRQEIKEIQEWGGEPLADIPLPTGKLYYLDYKYPDTSIT